MIEKIINGIMNLATKTIDLVLTPVNSLIENIFPNFSTIIGYFNTFVNQYIGSTLGWFFNLLPPITKQVMLLWFTFLVVYYGIVWSYNLIVKTYNVIQKIKFW